MGLESKDEAVDAATYFGDSGVRHEKGTGMDVIAAELEARIAKTARLKAIREARGPVLTKAEQVTRSKLTPRT
jgi:hypothetical protein